MSDPKIDLEKLLANKGTFEHMTLDVAHALLGGDRPSAWKVFQALEGAGHGTCKIGRRGAPTRFVWLRETSAPAAAVILGVAGPQEPIPAPQVVAAPVPAPATAPSDEVKTPAVIAAPVPPAPATSFAAAVVTPVAPPTPPALPPTNPAVTPVAATEMGAVNLQGMTLVVNTVTHKTFRCALPPREAVARAWAEEIGKTAEEMAAQVVRKTRCFHGGDWSAQHGEVNP